MTTVMFERRGVEYAVRFPFNRELVDVVKMSVPSFARTWNPTLKEWMVDAGYARTLADIIRRAGHTVLGLEPATPPRGDYEWASGVFRRVGPHRTDAVYRGLSKLLHPDVGGDTKLMQELNAARREIQEGTA